MVIDKIKKFSTEEESVKNEEASDRLVGKWVKCNNCKEILYKEKVRENYSICPNCGHYFRLSARRRIRQIIDENSFKEINEEIQTTDLLHFEGYKDKIKSLQAKTKINEAVTTGLGKINGIDVAIAVMDSNFFMGSMGYAVGEKITLLIEKAIKKRLPLIIICVSGGARMQEGIISLMQMAKTSSALARFNESGLLYISVLTDPTTGGVTASFASVADIILAEPGALIGFAGPRVVEQTIKQKLPEGFQKAEFLLEHGFVDSIVKRDEMKSTLSKILKMHNYCEQKCKEK